MRVLAIETATEACSVALFEDGVLVDAQHQTIGRGHAERLVPMISKLPLKGRANEIRVSLGPGSFTGTRIGLAAARALAIAWPAKVRGFPTLALVAACVRAKGHHDQLGVAMMGGHGEWFVQPFGADGMPLADHTSLQPDDAARFIPQDCVAGNRAADLVNCRGFGEATELLPDASHALGIPEGLLSDRLAPIYGRPPDARIPG